MPSMAIPCGGISSCVAKVDTTQRKAAHWMAALALSQHLMISKPVDIGVRLVLGVAVHSKRLIWQRTHPTWHPE